jgi:carbamoyl-phosphate synthase large subunit
MTKTPIKILITGAGGPASICTLKALNTSSAYMFYMADITLNAAGLYLVPEEQRLLLPPGNDSLYHKRLLELCIDHDIDLIIPTVDSELPSISKNIESFNKYNIKVAISNHESLSLSLDKYQLLKTCDDNNVYVGAFDLVSNAVNEDTWKDTPCVVKPRHGSGSRGIQLLSCISEMELDSSQYDDHLIHTLFPGQEYSVDMMISETGNVLACVPRERTRVKGGVVVESKVVKRNDIETYATQIAKQMKLSYMINIQVKEGEHGDLGLIEINPRASGGLSLIVAAGANTPQMCVDELIHNKQLAPVHYNEIRMLRYFSEVYLNN